MTSPAPGGPGAARPRVLLLVPARTYRAADFPAVAARLGLPHNPAEAVMNAADKARQRRPGPRSRRRHRPQPPLLPGRRHRHRHRAQRRDADHRQAAGHGPRPGRDPARGRRRAPAIRRRLIRHRHLPAGPVHHPQPRRSDRRNAAGSRPGGRLLLDHTGITWPPLYAAQWLAERITIRTAGEHFTRRQLPLVTAAGFQVEETERLKAGTVERTHAVKPA